MGEGDVRMIMLEWRKAVEGGVITELDLGRIRRGDPALPVQVVLVCTGEDVPNLLITSSLEEGDIGRGIDTHQSTWLSTNGTDWSYKLVVGLETDEELPLFVKWQPPSDALVGGVEWTLKVTVLY